MRRLLLLVGAIVFVDTMFFSALTPLLPEYAEEHNLSKAGAGLLSAAYPIGALVLVDCELRVARRRCSGGPPRRDDRRRDGGGDLRPGARRDRLVRRDRR